MATQNPYAKYVGGGQPGAVVTAMDPYADSAEQRAREDQAIERERLRLAREAAARADEESRINRQSKEEKLSAERAEAERLARAQASGISDALYQMRNVIDAARSAKELASSGAGIGSWEGSEGFRNSAILSIAGANSAANDMEALLNTVGSNTAFNRLQKMREESPTGGALGAVSQIELQLLRDSIASLSQRQSDEQFRSNMDKVIAAYTRVAGKLQSADQYYRANGSMEGYTPPTEEELAAIVARGNQDGTVPPPAAGAGATETSIPIPPEMQAEHAAYLRENWGRLDPQAYAAFRAGLDRKHKFEPRPEAYRGAVEGLNAAAAAGNMPAGYTIGPVNRDLTGVEQFRNDAVSSPFGTGAASFLNSAMVGLPAALAGREKMEAAADLNPGSAFAGDLLGGTAGALLTGGGISLGTRALGMTGRGVDFLTNPATADVLYGAAYGAMSDDDPLTGAVIGAGGALLGDQVGRLGGRAVGRLRSPADPLSGGQRAVASTVKNPDDVVAALAQANDLGVPMTLADASPELGSLAGSSVRFSPTVGNQARSVMAQRNEGQMDRLAAAVERDLGPVENIPQRSEDLLAQARAAAAPLYEQAYAAPGAESIPLDDLAGRPTFAAALREAYTEVLDEDIDPSAVGLQVAGDDIMLASPSWQALDYTKRGLDNIIERGKRQGDAPAVRRAMKMKNTLLSRMDEANPDYAEARRIYAGPMQERGFMEQGQQALRSSPDQLGVDMASLTPEQRQQMQLGFQSQTMENAGNLRGNSNPWAQLNTPNAERRLGVMYGDAGGAEIARLLSQRDLELQLAGSANRLVGNSATAEREIADQFFQQQPNMTGELATGIVETAALGGPWLTVGKGLTDRFMRDRREAAALAANRKLADEIGPILLNDVPPAAVEELTQMVADDKAYQEIVNELLRGGEVWGRRLGTGLSAASANEIAY